MDVNVRPTKHSLLTGRLQPQPQIHNNKMKTCTVTQYTHSIKLLIGHSAPSFYPFIVLHSAHCSAPRLIPKVTASTQLLPDIQARWENAHINTQRSTRRAVPTQSIFSFLWSRIYTQTEKDFPSPS